MTILCENHQLLNKMKSHANFAIRFCYSELINNAESSFATKQPKKLKMKLFCLAAVVTSTVIPDFLGDGLIVNDSLIDEEYLVSGS